MDEELYTEALSLLLWREALAHDSFMGGRLQHFVTSPWRLVAM